LRIRTAGNEIAPDFIETADRRFIIIPETDSGCKGKTAFSREFSAFYILYFQPLLLYKVKKPEKQAKTPVFSTAIYIKPLCFPPIPQTFQHSVFFVFRKDFL